MNYRDIFLGFVVIILWVLAYCALAGAPILCLVGLWKTFEKTGRRGWIALVPFYNLYVLYKIAGWPGAAFPIFLVGLLGGLIVSQMLWLGEIVRFAIETLFVGVLILSINVAIDIAKAFGKSRTFGFFLVFLMPFIGLPILGFGKCRYHMEIAYPGSSDVSEEGERD